MNSHASPFLTAEWRHLAMLTFEVDPRVLSPLVPAGTELDAWRGRTFVSIVGFLFLDTRVFGAAIPFHRHFEEVNLRFYVRRMASDGWRRRRLREGDRAAYRDCLDREGFFRRELRCHTDAAPHRRGGRLCCRTANGLVLLVVLRAREPNGAFCRRQRRRGCCGKRHRVHNGTLLGLRSTKRRAHNRVPRGASALAGSHGDIKSTRLRRRRAVRKSLCRVLEGASGLCISR